MCYDHQHQPLTPGMLARVEQMWQDMRVKCVPALGIHEHCEHWVPRADQHPDPRVIFAP